MKKLFLIMAFVLSFGVFGCAAQEVSTENTEIIEEVKEPETYSMRLTAIGDMMVHEWQLKDAYNSETGEYDFSHNFTDVKKYFDEADYVVGNLETTLAGDELGYTGYPCFNTPDDFADAIKEAGVDLVTTANNHSMDKRGDGLLRTIEVLDEKGIDHVGTYSSAVERENILIKNINGIKVAFLSYTYGTNGIRIPEEYMVNLLDEDLMVNDIHRAKAMNPDVIVVMPHMGNEYETYTRDIFKDYADVLLEAGADIVLASHPHVLQPMEIKTVVDKDGTERECFVIYSLGNFISSQTTPPRNAGIILNLDLSMTEGERFKIDEISFTPIWTQFNNAQDINDFCVRSVYEMLTLPDDEIYNVIRKMDHQRLKDIHYEVTQMYLEDDVPMEEIKDVYTFYKRGE